MTSAHLTTPRRARRDHDPIDELLPMVDVVPQAGPPAYMVAAFAAVVALLACPPLAILATILLIGLVASAAVAALVAATVVLPLMLLRRVVRHVQPSTAIGAGVRLASSPSRPSAARRSGEVKPLTIR